MVSTQAPTGTRGAEHAAARRDVARRLHPDRGGDAASFAEALRRVDERYATTPAPRGRVEVHRTWRARARRAARLTMLRLRCRLPAACPGARRYGRL